MAAVDPDLAGRGDVARVTYRPVAVVVNSCGILGYSAHVVLEDDGLPESECPVHGWDGPKRDRIGSPLEELTADCRCPWVPGFDLEQGPYDAFTHRRAFRKAVRGVGGRLYERTRPRGDT